MKKQPYLTIVVLISFLFLFSSCFEIIEDIKVNPDGSGHVKMTLNMSQSKTKLNSVLLLDSVNGYKVPSKSEIQARIDELVVVLKKTQGISHVNKSINFDEFIFTIACDFNNTEALNIVISNLGSIDEAKKIQQHKHFAYNKSSKTFSRSYHYDPAKEFKNINPKDQNIFEKASYTSIYRFENTIKSSSNKNALISGNKKAIMLRVETQDLINNKKTIKNNIKLN